MPPRCALVNWATPGRRAPRTSIFWRRARAASCLPAFAFRCVCPRPFAVVSSVVIAEALAPIEAAYERAMIGEVAALCRHIPHGDLCIQWDLCNEMVIWDGQHTDAVPFAQEPRGKLLERMARLAAAVPDDVQLGLHLCYGDFGARHFVEPKDASAMVEFANALASAIKRKLAYIHMPVPIERSDDTFHRPFGALALPNATELYLDVVHVRDGVEGTKARIAAAGRYAPPFGIATECGMSRARSEATVHKLLQIHGDICAGL
jgi:hypothetical protein